MSFARVIAQLVMVGTNVVTKAFMQAYQQAKQGGGQAARAAAQAGRMSSDQAREVLNLAKGPLDKEAIIAQFTKYYESNDPEKGGSFYIQSKVWNAKETLLEDFKRQQAKAAKEAAAKEAAASSSNSSAGTSSSSSSASGDRFSALPGGDATLFSGSGRSAMGGGRRWMSTAAAGAGRRRAGSVAADELR